MFLSDLIGHCNRQHNAGGQYWAQEQHWYDISIFLPSNYPFLVTCHVTSVNSQLINSTWSAVCCEAYRTVDGSAVLKQCVFLHPHRHSVLRFLPQNSFHVIDIAMGIGKVLVYYWCSSDWRYFLWYEMNSAFVRRSLMTLMRKFGELRALDKLSDTISWNQLTIQFPFPECPTTTRLRWPR